VFSFSFLLPIFQRFTANNSIASSNVLHCFYHENHLEHSSLFQRPDLYHLSFQLLNEHLKNLVANISLTYPFSLEHNLLVLRQQRTDMNIYLHNDFLMVKLFRTVTYFLGAPLRKLLEL
jgi:hypothetical protein